MKKVVIILLFFGAFNKLSAQFVDASNSNPMTDTSNTDVVLRNRSINGGTFQYMTPTMFKAFMSSLTFWGTSKGANVKIWDTVFVASTSNGQTLDISSAGFSSAPMVYATAERNTATATSSPQISLKTRSATSLSFNLTEGNNNIVTVLGISVLGGAANIFSPTPSSITIHVIAIGN